MFDSSSLQNQNILEIGLKKISWVNNCARVVIPNAWSKRNLLKEGDFIKVISTENYLILTVNKLDVEVKSYDRNR